MSAEKKVLLLLLSFIILIVVCVSTHIPNFMKEENASKIVEVEKTEIIDSQNVADAIKDESKVTEQKTEEVEISNSVNEENTVKEVLSEENNPTGEDLSVVEEKELLVINEIPEIPLITTDKRYIRNSGEKRIEELSKKTQELQIKMGDYIKENPVAFTRGSFKLTKKSNKTIEMVVEALKEFENLKIEVAGHTDAIGARALNQSISLKRAEAVKEKLVSLGIVKDRIIARGYGEDIPLVKNSINGYSKVNRRVEFNIIEE